MGICKGSKMHPPFFEKVADHIVALEHLGSFEPQHLSITVWAFAKAKVSRPDLFEKVADAIIMENMFESFKPQGLSNILWAFI